MAPINGEQVGSFSLPEAFPSPPLNPQGEGLEVKTVRGLVLAG